MGGESNACHFRIPGDACTIVFMFTNTVVSICQCVCQDCAWNTEMSKVPAQSTMTKQCYTYPQKGLHKVLYECRVERYLAFDVLSMLSLASTLTPICIVSLFPFPPHSHSSTFRAEMETVPYPKATCQSLGPRTPAHAFAWPVLYTNSIKERTELTFTFVGFYRK